MRKKRLLLARPTYGDIDPKASKALNIAMMTAAHDHVTWVDDVSFDREAWAKSRNMSHSAAILHPDADGVLWTDDDMVPSPTAIAQLISADKNFVSALCFERRPPYKPTFARGSQEKGYNRGKRWPDDSLIQVDAVGFGFVYTSMTLLLAVGPNPFTGNLGEDYRFCQKAVNLGFTPWVDTGCHVGHLGERVVIDQRDFLMHSGKFKASGTLPADRDPNRREEPVMKAPRQPGSKQETVN